VAATPDASSRCQFDPEATPGLDPHATGVALPSSPARTVFDPHATGADSGLATAPPPGGATSAWRGAT